MLPNTFWKLGGGALEVIYNQRSPRAAWTIIEPQPHPLPETSAFFIQGFFPDALPEKFDFDMLVHTHTMEHMYSPKEFMRKVSMTIPKGRRMIFSVPNLKLNLKKGMTSVINFEHTIFLSDDYIEYLLKKNNFQIEEKRLFGEHSIIYSTLKLEEAPSGNELTDFKKLYAENKKLYENYIDLHDRKIGYLNNLIDKETRPIYLFGGHITTQYYIAFGLHTRKIMAVIDNDPYKQGKRVGGTSLKIQSPMVMNGLKAACVILPQSPYTKEIKEGILKDVNSNVEFWE